MSPNIALANSLVAYLSGLELSRPLGTVERVYDLPDNLHQMQGLRVRIMALTREEDTEEAISRTFNGYQMEQGILVTCPLSAGYTTADIDSLENLVNEIAKAVTDQVIGNATVVGVVRNPLISLPSLKGMATFVAGISVRFASLESN